MAIWSKYVRQVEPNHFCESSAVSSLCWPKALHVLQADRIGSARRPAGALGTFRFQLCIDGFSCLLGSDMPVQMFGDVSERDLVT